MPRPEDGTGALPASVREKGDGYPHGPPAEQAHQEERRIAAGAWHPAEGRELEQQHYDNARDAVSTHPAITHDFEASTRGRRGLEEPVAGIGEPVDMQSPGDRQENSQVKAGNDGHGKDRAQ